MKKKTRTQNVSWLVEAFPLGHPLASIISHCFVFFALLRCNYLSHPCHIQGNTLRGFDILTATEDGHNLQRHSTQAGRRAGGDSKGKTVSWTTAVRNVSNQGQGEEGTGSGEREGQRHNLSSFAAHFTNVEATAQTAIARIQNIYQTVSNVDKYREVGAEWVLDPGGSLRLQMWRRRGSRRNSPFENKQSTLLQSNSKGTVYTGSCFSADNTAGAVPLQYILTSIHCYLWQRHRRLIPETNSFFRPFWREFVVESHPPTSLQRSEINESEAWTLTWLLRHEQEATLPPSVAIMLSSHWLLMLSGLLAEMVSYGRDKRMGVFVLKKTKNI